MKSKRRQPETIVEFKNVGKRFFRQSQRTLKELIPALLKRPSKSEDKRVLWALKDVSFKVRRGESLGVIGLNGAGKSTVLKLIAGVTQPTEGEVVVRGRVSPLIELGAGFHPELTGRENVYLNASILGIPKKKVDKKFKEIVDFAELWEFIDTPVKHYSSGMYMRLGFAVAVNVEPEILLIDEILAVGDVAFQQKCLKKMREFKKAGVTIIFVSHSLTQVAEFCQRAVWLEAGRVKEIGPATEVTAKFEKGALK